MYEHKTTANRFIIFLFNKFPAVSQAAVLILQNKCFVCVFVSHLNSHIITPNPRWISSSDEFNFTHSCVLDAPAAWFVCHDQESVQVGQITYCLPEAPKAQGSDNYPKALEPHNEARWQRCGHKSAGVRQCGASCTITTVKKNYSLKWRLQQSRAIQT